MSVVGNDGGGDEDGPMEGVGRAPLERHRGEGLPGVTVGHRPLVDSTAGHVAADCGQAGVVSTERNVPTSDSQGVSLGCNYLSFIIILRKFSGGCQK